MDSGATAKKRVLNVGGNSKAIPLPPQYADFEHVLLDIDEKCCPDILCDARELCTLEPSQYDAVYCSHNLEHFYRHDVKKVLAGFLHVLKDDGFAQIIVPNIIAVMEVVMEKGLDVEDFLYHSPAGPIKVIDVFYGYDVFVEKSGSDFMAHKTGFSPKSLGIAIKSAGFQIVYWTTGGFIINALAFKENATQSVRELFNLPPSS